MTLAVKVALNPNTTNQLNSSSQAVLYASIYDKGHLVIEVKRDCQIAVSNQINPFPNKP